MTRIKKLTGGLASNADYQIIGANVQIRNFYTGYGNELERLNVEKAGEDVLRRRSKFPNEPTSLEFAYSSIYRTTIN